MPLERGAPDISAYHAAQKPGFWPRLLPEEIEISQLSRLGAQWTHLFGSNVEGNVNGGFVQSFANHSGIVATVTGDGLVVRQPETRIGSNMAAVSDSASPRAGSPTSS
jgi:hypothetical protein